MTSVASHALRKATGMRDLIAKHVPAILVGFLHYIRHRTTFFGTPVVAPMVKAVVYYDADYFDMVSGIFVPEGIERLGEQGEPDGCEVLGTHWHQHISGSMICCTCKYGLGRRTVNENKVLFLEVIRNEVRQYLGIGLHSAHQVIGEVESGGYI